MKFSCIFFNKRHGAWKAIDFSLKLYTYFVIANKYTQILRNSMLKQSTTYRRVRDWNAEYLRAQFFFIFNFKFNLIFILGIRL